LNGSDIHNIGLELHLLKGGVKETWSWLQRGKARALMDLLGLGVIIPIRFKEEAEKDERKRRMLRTEADMLDELRQCQPGERFGLRRDLGILRNAMARIDGLKEILSLRGADAVDLEDLRGVFSGMSNVVCVDWFVSENSVFLLSIRPGGSPNLCDTSVSVDDITRWKRNYYTKEELQNEKANTWLRKLDGLVSPLATQADDGDQLDSRWLE